MNAAEAIAYIHARPWQNSRPGLHRMRALLERLGDPQRELKFIHVGGTNGKGSTCACLDAVLRQAGYRVGLNTSPYLLCFNERIRVDGAQITDQALVSLLERVRPAAESMDEPPTEFELITAMALLHFRDTACHIVVLEVGLGGALDASNVICAPEVAVLTAMGMDHVKELGPTMADIAAAKAGIIKPGGDVVSYGGCAQADEVFRAVCRRQGATLTEVDLHRLERQTGGLEGTTFDFLPYQELFLSLPGAYQVRNAATAITALEVLRRKGWKITDDHIRQGLASVSWPGRFQVLRRRPLVLLDGAHNPQGMDAAVESLQGLLPGKAVFLVGVLTDKDVRRMMTPLLPLAASFVAVRPDSPRAMAAEDLCALLRDLGGQAEAAETVADGVRLALERAGTDGAVCALGSLYFSGDVRQAVERLLP